MIYLEKSSVIFELSMINVLFMSFVLTAFRKNHEVSDHFEIVHAGKFSLARVSSAGSEQAGDGAFFLLAHNGGDGGRKQFLNSGHVLTVPGGFVKTGAGPGVGIV